MMSPEEAEVMQELMYAIDERRVSVDSHIIEHAQQILAQHADDQQPTTLPWLVENYRGETNIDGCKGEWWEFFCKVGDRDGEPAGELAIINKNGETYWELIDNDTCRQIVKLPCPTRGDVRALERLGLLVLKKKGEVE